MCVISRWSGQHSSRCSATSLCHFIIDSPGKYQIDRGNHYFCVLCTVTYASAHLFAIQPESSLFSCEGILTFILSGYFYSMSFPIIAPVVRLIKDGLMKKHLPTRHRKVIFSFLVDHNAPCHHLTFKLLGHQIVWLIKMS